MLNTSLEIFLLFYRHVSYTLHIFAESGLLGPKMAFLWQDNEITSRKIQ